MTKRISQLTALTGIDFADSIPIVDNSTGQTKKVTLLELFKLVYKFSVYRAAAWTTSNGTYAKVNFDTELYDDNSNFDSTTNFRYVAPINGTYHFDAGVGEATTSSGGVGLVVLYKNGAEIMRGTELAPSGAINTCRTVSGDLKLVATDYIEVYFFGNNKAGQVGSFITRFTGHLVSPE